MKITREHVFPSGNKLVLHSATASFYLDANIVLCSYLAVTYLEKPTDETGEDDWWLNNSEFFHPSQQKLAEAVYSYRLSKDEDHAFKFTDVGQNMHMVHAKELALRYDNIIPWVSPSIDAVKYVKFIMNVEDSIGIGRKFLALFEEDLRRTAQSNKGILKCFYTHLTTQLEKEDSRHELMNTVWTFFNFT